MRCNRQQLLDVPPRVLYDCSMSGILGIGPDQRELLGSVSTFRCLGKRSREFWRESIEAGKQMKLIRALLVVHVALLSMHLPKQLT